MLCLGIESTAHTFAGSIIDYSGIKEHPSILSDARSIYTSPAGSGIHPREASRHHALLSSKVIKSALLDGKLKATDLSLVSYSAGPGLGPCLRIGAVAARCISSYFNKPLMPVNHAIGHIELGITLTSCEDPLVLLISGGHSAIAVFAGSRWRVIGETLDITLGQLIDQFGRFLGFSSPCGSKIEELASKSMKNYIMLPYTVKGNDITFSGLLSALKRSFNEKILIEDLCFSLQETAFAMLCESLERAIAVAKKRELLIVGGVAANKRLADMLKSACIRHGIDFRICPPQYSGDNGVQIAWTGALQFISNNNSGVEISESVVKQSWRLDEVDICWRG